MGRLAKLCVVVLVVSVVLGGGSAAVGSEKVAPSLNIRILKNAEFTRETGVSEGKGTAADPYVFSGLELNSLHIENTSKYVEIKNNTIAGQLLLDWVGDRAKVHYNSIGQLDVNRNVARTGAPTSGSMVHNTFGNVNQLRHWDGLFANNTVGRRDQLNARAANFDGFNGARYDRNTFYGFVDARLHDHHHSTGFDGGSHIHDGMDHGKNHSQRYHSATVTNNRITTSHDYALAYLDTGHAGNDRTAPSETNEALNDPHAHHTRVRFSGNKLSGAGILVDVFNATDDKHLRTYAGLVDIEKNSITLGKDDFFSAKQLNGIEVRNAKDLRLSIEKNAIIGWKPGNGFFDFLEQWDTNAGIFLAQVEKANIRLLGNRVENRTHGIRAANFKVDVDWVIGGLTTKNVTERVHAENVPRKARTA